MKILVVMRNAPTPTTGANMRNLALLRALCQFHHVSLLIVADDVAQETREAQAVQGLVESAQVVPAAPGYLKRLYQFAGLLLHRPSIVWRSSSPALGRALRQHLTEGAFDAVFYEGIMVAGHALPNGPQRIIDEHNLEWELLERSARQASSALRRVQNQRESEALRRMELAALGRADLVIVTSERERAALLKLLPAAIICVVPNGVDVERFAPGDADEEIAGRVVFTGSMDYHPNEQAAGFFAEQCWPLILRARPDATWYLVGANPPHSVRRLGDLPGVTVTGSVPETRPYLAQAQVTIAPLLVGGGTRLKILEALAMGKAMVSTTIGFEGLNLIPDDHLLIADTPAQFAEAVVRALDDASLRARLGASGRAAVVRQYSWAQSGQTLQRALDGLTSPELASQRRGR